MRPLLRTALSLAAAVAVMALAFWAYRENYATQQALKDQRAVQREIAGLREAIAVQRAEWAYLNRPDRLADLAAASFDRLGLLPMTAEAFATIAAIPAPQPPEPLVPVTGAITGAVDTAGPAAATARSAP
ncbi:MAG: cell division protein FtsL [Gemmobacter sp.]